MQASSVRRPPIFTGRLTPFDRSASLANAADRSSPAPRQVPALSGAVVATVAMQEDYMKRVHYHGGSRSRLQPRGIVILGHYSSHGRIAAALRLPVPGSGESVSARLAPARPHYGEGPRIELDRQEWVLARPDDPEEAVPKLSET
ncbi:NaeI family type II restriction endonuclease [Streptomyces lydicus]|uniref:NaeI family type II restriction endonuclease n=1 Tax=Streptomyces lydicus TaxID=47763 RepID=UPI0022C14136|nr:NaeI family type II restriction endonuclease [Streptomyces lydicus]MCZ1008106.1 NaeI family type II restriction endonuclease [Streptomyces lydicus]